MGVRENAFIAKKGKLWKCVINTESVKIKILFVENILTILLYWLSNFKDILLKKLTLWTRESAIVDNRLFLWDASVADRRRRIAAKHMKCYSHSCRLYLCKRTTTMYDTLWLSPNTIVNTCICDIPLCVHPCFQMYHTLSAYKMTCDKKRSMHKWT